MLDDVEAHRKAVLEQAARVRAIYEQTGQVPPFGFAPHLNIARYAAHWAVQYARQAIPRTCDLPKRFEWIGGQYLLVIPDDAPVEILDPQTYQSLCVGLFGWKDPMKAGPRAR